MESDGRIPSPASWRSRAIPGLLFFLLLVGVWADPLFFRRNFAGRDLIAYNLPLEKGIHDAYVRGVFPLWQPEISGGRPLLPNPNAGALYPLRVLFSRVRFPVAVKIFPVFHWIAAGLGMMALLRSAGASRPAIWIGAVTYAFSGVSVSEVYFPHILPGLALMPWIVWAVGRRSSWPSQVLVLSLLFALDILAGDVFTIGVALLCALAWIGVAVSPDARKNRALVLAVGVGLAVVAALPQIVATALWVPETNRAVTGIRLGEALQFSLSPFRLLELIIPFPFGSTWTIEGSSIWGWKVFDKQMMGLFLTIYPGALGMIGLCVTWKNRQPMVRFGRWLVFIALLLAVPGSLVPESAKDWRSPLPLRNPEKFAVVLAFGMAILAAAGLDELRRRERPPRWTFVLGLVLSACAVAAALFPAAAAKTALLLTRTPKGFMAAATQELPMALTEGAFLWVVTWLALGRIRSPRFGFRLASLGVLTLVPITATRRIPWTLREEEVFAPPGFVRFQRLRDPDNRYRTLSVLFYKPPSPMEIGQAGSDPAYAEFARRNWMQHAQALWGRGTVFNSDFDNGDLSRIESARKISAIAAGFKDGARFFESFALRFEYRYRDQAPLSGFHRVAGTELEDWDENPAALPDIRLVSGWTEERGAVAALERMTKLDSGEIVIETGRQARGTSAGGAVRVLENHPERLRLETDAAAPGWLFVLRGFWRHRTVLVDGDEVEVSPAQLAFSAIPVPQGRHIVDWKEHFPGWSVSRVGPVLYVLCLALLFARSRARRSIGATGAARPAP